ncbi:MAG: hypothetical protein ACM3O4_02360 [Ignavibacteriales bacterium]
MLSKEQEEEKRLKILKVAKYFFEHGGSIEEVSAATGIPESSVQRYLHDPIIINDLGKDVYDVIQEKIKQNKIEAVIKGGKTYAENNDYIKDEIGKFTGSKRK